MNKYSMRKVRKTPNFNDYNDFWGHIEQNPESGRNRPSKKVAEKVKKYSFFEYFPESASISGSRQPLRQLCGYAFPERFRVAQSGENRRGKVFIYPDGKTPHAGAESLRRRVHRKTGPRRAGFRVYEALGGSLGRVPDLDI